MPKTVITVVAGEGPIAGCHHVVRPGPRPTGGIPPKVRGRLIERLENDGFLVDGEIDVRNHFPPSVAPGGFIVDRAVVTEQDPGPPGVVRRSPGIVSKGLGPAAEQARIVQLLIDRVIVGSAGLELKLRVDGLDALARELQVPELEEAA